MRLPVLRIRSKAQEGVLAWGELHINRSVHARHYSAHATEHFAGSGANLLHPPQREVLRLFARIETNDRELVFLRSRILDANRMATGGERLGKLEIVVDQLDNQIGAGLRDTGASR